MDTEPSEMLQILVVDDSVVSRKLAELALLGKPYSVQFAEDARQALGLMTRRCPEIVITDWMMPNLTGLELCKRIRSQPGLRHIYIILLSTNSTANQKTEGMAAGADAFLSKPLQMSELLGQIHAARRVLKTRKNEAERQLSGLVRT